MIDVGGRAAQDGGAVVVTEGLTKRYPRVTALDGLTVSVPPGVVGLVGANGAGTQRSTC